MNPEDVVMIMQWDSWFDCVKDEESSRTWAVAKQVFTDPLTLNNWATIIEMNRLNRLNETTPNVGGGCGDRVG